MSDLSDFVKVKKSSAPPAAAAVAPVAAPVVAAPAGGPPLSRPASGLYGQREGEPPSLAALAVDGQPPGQLVLEPQMSQISLAGPPLSRPPSNIPPASPTRRATPNPNPNGDAAAPALELKAAAPALLRPSAAPAAAVANGAPPQIDRKQSAAIGAGAGRASVAGGEPDSQLMSDLLSSHAAEINHLAQSDEFFHVGVMRKLGYSNRVWRERLFALSRRDVTLHYFRSRADFEARKSAGEIFLKNAFCYLSVDYLETRFALELSTPLRNYWLSAAEPTPLCQWIRIFSRHGVVLRHPIIPFPTLEPSAVALAQVFRTTLNQATAQAIALSLAAMPASPPAAAGGAASASPATAAAAALPPLSVQVPASFDAPIASSPIAEHKRAADELHTTQLAAVAASPTSSIVGFFSADTARASAPASHTSHRSMDMSGAAAAAAKFRRQLSDGTSAVAGDAIASTNNPLGATNPFALFAYVYRLSFAHAKYGIIQKRGAIITSFRTRFCRTLLTASGGPVLVYFDTFYSVQPKGSIALAEAKIESKEGPIFTIQSKGNNRTFVFRARSVQEKTSWVETLQCIATNDLVCRPPALVLPPLPSVPAAPPGGPVASPAAASASAAGDSKSIEIVISSPPVAAAQPTPTPDAATAAPAPAPASDPAPLPDHKSDAPVPSAADHKSDAPAAAVNAHIDQKHTPAAAAVAAPSNGGAAVAASSNGTNGSQALGPPPALILQSLAPLPPAAVVVAAAAAAATASASAGGESGESIASAISLLVAGTKVLKMPHRGKAAENRISIESVAGVYSIRWQSKTKSAAECVLPLTPNRTRVIAGHTAGAFKDNSSGTKQLTPTQLPFTFTVQHPKRTLDAIALTSDDFNRWMRVLNHILNPHDATVTGVKK